MAGWDLDLVCRLGGSHLSGPLSFLLTALLTLQGLPLVDTQDRGCSKFLPFLPSMKWSKVQSTGPVQMSSMM